MQQQKQQEEVSLAASFPLTLCSLGEKGQAENDWGETENQRKESNGKKQGLEKGHQEGTANYEGTNKLYA